MRSLAFMLWLCLLGVAAASDTCASSHVCDIAGNGPKVGQAADLCSDFPNGVCRVEECCDTNVDAATTVQATICLEYCNAMQGLLCNFPFVGVVFCNPPFPFLLWLYRESSCWLGLNLPKEGTTVNREPF